MWFTEAVLSALLFGLAGWWMKVSQMRGGSSAYLLLGLYVSGTIGFGIHAIAEGSLAGSLADWRIWCAGALIGAGSALGNALFMKALECGPASLTSPLTNMNIILVVLLGTFVYKEPFTRTELLGVLLLLLAVLLISIRIQDHASIRNRRWFAYVGISIVLFAIRNGGLKITEELGLPGASVLFVAYALSIAWFGIPALQERRGIQSAGAVRPDAGQTLARAFQAPRIGYRLGLAAGLFSYGGLQLYTLSLQTGQANIAGPIFASNSLIVAIGSIVLYRERLTGRQWLAFACLFAGLICIRL